MAKVSISDVRSKAYSVPTLRFDEQKLTSFSGLVIIQQLFTTIGLKKQIACCFKAANRHSIYTMSSCVLMLVVHLLLGYRQFRHMDYYRDDPLVCRITGLHRFPNVSTLTRQLATTAPGEQLAMQSMSTNLVLARLVKLALHRVTVDFDGSVTGTCRYAQGAAVGFNRKKKGQRSYYPLLSTVSQTAQVLDVLHRSGNVHDSNGSLEFIEQTLEQVRLKLPNAQLESRMDAAFYSEATVELLERINVNYSISLPFERFPALKSIVESRRRWAPIDANHDGFELQWKPKSWDRKRSRVLIIRQRSKVQKKGPVQLDLFEPYDEKFEYKAIVTNHVMGMANTMKFHNGRGSQEGIFAELKTHAQMDYVPAKRWSVNKIFVTCSVLAHNLTRELQMRTQPADRTTMPKRPALWAFEKLDTIRRRLLLRAGRIINPGGTAIISMAANDEIEVEFSHILERLRCSA